MYLSQNLTFSVLLDSLLLTHKGTILVVSKIIDIVMLFAQEAKNGVGFINSKKIMPIFQALEDMGHPQGPTPLQFGNKCATVIINDKIRQKASKCMDMQFY